MTYSHEKQPTAPQIETARKIFASVPAGRNYDDRLLAAVDAALARARATPAVAPHAGETP